MKRWIFAPFYLLILLFSLSTSALATTSNLFPNSSTLVSYTENGLYGFQSKSGTVVVPAQFQAVGDFSEGMARVKQNDAWGYISTTGILLVDCIYDEVYDYSEGYALVGVYNATGTLRYGFIDRTGTQITYLQYDYAQSFSEGRAMVGYIDTARTETYYASGGWRGPLYRVGYINTSGTLVIPMNYHLSDVAMGDFSDGLAMVLQDDQPYAQFPLFAFINTSGTLITPFTYHTDSYVSYEDGYVIITAAEQETDAPHIEVWDTSGAVVLDALALGYNKLSYLGQGLYLASYTLQSAQRYYDVIDLQGTVILSDASADASVSNGYLSSNGESYLISSITNLGAEALPSGMQFIVNGTYIEVDAYLIEEENYIKLRDMAMLLQGSSKQFQITWDETVQAIHMTSGLSYTPVGGELSQGDDLILYATSTTADIYVDLVSTPFTAYHISGNNYFRLRDVMACFDVSVAWDSSSYTVTLDTNQSYQP